MTDEHRYGTIKGKIFYEGETMTKLFSAKLNASGNIVLSGGQVILNFHEASICGGEFCPVHKPSEHDYRDYPLFFNGVNMVRELDQETVIPDPDDYYFNKRGSAIISNSAKCKDCGEEIFSIYRHDYQTCLCGNISVDGGRDYIRHGFKNTDSYENTSKVFTKN